MPIEPLLPFDYPCSQQVAMPMGGLGAGCICLNGEGGLIDFSLHHVPNTTALPDGWNFSTSAFATLRVGGRKPVVKLLEGPLPPGKIYDQGLQTQGFRHGAYEGLPRFQQSRFRAGYPFGQVELEHPDVPLGVTVLGWSPFVPLDDVASGLPCSIIEYAFTNRTRREINFEFAFHLSNLTLGPAGWPATRNEVIRSRGIHFSNLEPAHSEPFGTSTLTVVGHRPNIKAMWLRGGWFDPISALWREVEAGAFKPNNGQDDAGCNGGNGGSVQVKGTLAPKQSVTVPVVITWHFPNSRQIHGALPDAVKPESAGSYWRPFYASKWQDAGEVASYVHAHYPSLRERTVAFQNALLGSDLPMEVLDALSANLAILKSPTILRQENGNVWGWEGCFTQRGSCHGTCTHVWNYAQAMPHLFPALERTLREQEWLRSMDERGHVNFRAALPDGPTNHEFRAAADGQLGGPLKLYREWQISGDTAWLREMYPLARRSLEYCIGTWDPAEEGLLTKPHHNTYDIDFWGADGMCTSIYLGALSAMSLLADTLELAEDKTRYGALAQKGASKMAATLFNGEYFEQTVSRAGWQNNVHGSINDVPTSKAMSRLLSREGPKYQYGKGCLSDGIIGVWMAVIYGVPVLLDPRKIVSNLRAIHRHNFKRDLSDHACTQRPGYALGKEAGLLLCTWPRGNKPILPFVYSDEVWTGIEYQVASHLAIVGLVKEALEIVQGVRSRYAGDVRNPFNEYECGSYYARAMASYALLGAWSGFRYSAVEKKLWFAPVSGQIPFRCFFCCASGFGYLSLDADSLTITVVEGVLVVDHVETVQGKSRIELSPGLVVKAGSPERIAFPARPVLQSVRRDSTARRGGLG